MNYSNHDCRQRTTGSKLARLFRRKPAPKSDRGAKAENRLLSALRAVTQIGAALFALSVTAQAANDANYFFLQPNEAASKDAKVYKFLNDLNFQSNLGVVGTGADPHQFRSLIQFDLGALTVNPAAITFATLELYCSAVTPFDDGGTPPVVIPESGLGVVSLHQVTTAWSEADVTWDTYPTFSPTTVSSTLVDTAGKWYSFDVTDIVRGWADGSTTNLGLAIQMDSPNGQVTLAGSANSSFNVGQAPRLTVVPEPASAMLGLLGLGACLLRRRRAVAG
jgi:MYXO-CTERM domain-containing protein